MIQARIQMEFTPSMVDEALLILQSIVERTRAEAGCVSCSVYQEAEMENKIVFAQEWRSEEDLQRHLSSEDYRKVLLVMEMACAPPEIRFDTITGTSGVETIEKALAKTEA
jgi:quinol monooxygenase YgiN